MAKLKALRSCNTSHRGGWENRLCHSRFALDQRCFTSPASRESATRGRDGRRCVVENAGVSNSGSWRLLQFLWFRLCPGLKNQRCRPAARSARALSADSCAGQLSMRNRSGASGSALQPRQAKTKHPHAVAAVRMPSAPSQRPFRARMRRIAPGGATLLRDG